jgi:hypothetical protein
MWVKLTFLYLGLFITLLEDTWLAQPPICRHVGKSAFTFFPTCLSCNIDVVLFMREVFWIYTNFVVAQMGNVQREVNALSCLHVRCTVGVDLPSGNFQRTVSSIGSHPGPYPNQASTTVFSHGTAIFHNSSCKPTNACMQTNKQKNKHILEMQPIRGWERDGGELVGGGGEWIEHDMGLSCAFI